MISSDIFVNAAMVKTASISDYPAISGIDHAILSNGKIVNFVSDNHGFISNQDFFGSFEQKLRDEHIKFEAIYKNYDDCRFTADYILEGSLYINPEHRNKYKNEDVIKPKLRLTNSYDGKVPLAGYFGFHRMVCSNGLHVATNELAFTKKRTKKNIEFIFPTMSEMIENYKKHEAVTLTRTFDVLAEKTIQKYELKNVIKSIANSTNCFKYEKSDTNDNPSINAEFVLDVVDRETKHFDIKPNAWIVYNAMNEWIYSDERNKKHDNMRRDLDSKVFTTISEYAGIN